ncbi:zinc-ribbon domain-containing protein [Aurantiacibacter aquimixticola]|uniref:Thioredoxin n=1 Tax=Aurantiacibacter aquimixticola TaxID=1958945 RepID=A0A419RVG3_9SPHN|nr:zinc-ribbon domain-containing protein [Aurantiacibacter aquimixticola]RJY09775.1 thioredoxin [Aurantiacibacter aquimixticola]
MIIQCPACATKYVVPDAAVGVEGRTVRCAKCRESWFQEGPALDLADREDVAVEPAAPPPSPPPPPGAPASQETVENDVAPPPDGPSASAWRDEVRPPRAQQPVDYGDPPHSHFDHEPPFRPRRNWLKVWTWAGAIFAVVAAALIVAVSYWGLPDWVPVERPTFAAGEPDLQLDFPQQQQERRQLPNGTEFFGASGTITNVGTVTRTIPTILIVLRDSRDRIVYSWEVPPPQRTLAPGETVTVNEAVTDFPRSARAVQIGWKPE